MRVIAVNPVISIIEEVYKAGFKVWNKLIETSITMFTQSPKDVASGDLYTKAESIYNAIVDVTVPLATLFFIIAIYKSLSSTPPEQQARKFMLDTIKYIIILYISTQLWNVMGYVVDFSDGITTSVAGDLDSCQIPEDGNDLFDEMNNFEFSGFDILDIGGSIADLFKDLFLLIVYFVGGLASIFILGAAGITVIGVAFQRIIKPLVIMPFGAIVLGIGSCSGEGERMMWHFGKSFLAFCISGAFMVAAIKIGNSLITDYELPTNDVSGSIKAILLIVKVDLSAIVITGLLKSMDGIVAKAFG
ncbi:MAG: hypothetical protein J6Y02_07990 [Pseudobutyrivibrio sp.]|nr:hypothetical protein [Pseudobutyrivibrio sp.]